MNRFFLGAILALILSQSAPALEPAELAGSWVAGWPNGTQNALSLRFIDGRFSGTYVNDARDQCSVTGA